MTTLTNRLNVTRDDIPFIIWVALLVLLMIWGVVSGLNVFINGIGVTALTDQVPWGLWIVLDLSAISLGAGAFVFSAVVYLFGLDEYRKFARAAVLIGFLGYTSAMFALALDIGRPDRFYFPVIYPNVHSVLWEITMCVMIYFLVLAAEMAPVVLESKFVTARWPNAPKIGHQIHKATPVLAVLGLGLSLLHQSSLGATYGVVAARPLWYKPSLPVMFILSAVAGGISATIIGTLTVSYFKGYFVIAKKTIEKAALIAAGAQALYMYIKIWDWATTNYYSQTAPREADLALLRLTSPYDFSYWGVEVFLGGLVPLVIFLVPALRRNYQALTVGAALTILGLVFMRWNVTVAGLVLPIDWSPGTAFLFTRVNYVPTIPEWGAFFGIVAYALLGFTLAVRYLPIYADDPEGAHH
jgi:molybdopterin-containing oxidoreductase family membrane subunit